MTEKKGGRNILDITNGFHVMVNFYIMRYMYSHMDDKADGLGTYGNYMDIREESFYKTIGTTKQRTLRILHGGRFEMTAEYVDLLVLRFGLERAYFDRIGRSDGAGGKIEVGRFIEVASVSIEDWKCFFDMKYETDFAVTEHPENLQAAAERVRVGLEKLMQAGTIENEYAKSSAVYRVYYFYKYGEPYQEETALIKFRKAINALKLSDWEEIEDKPEEMDEYKRVLEMHLNYLRIVSAYRRIKEETKKE